MSEQPVGFSSLTEGDWTCMICKRVRAFNEISVAHRALKGAEDGFPGTRVNVRYCADNVDCAMIATADEPWDPAEAPLAEPVPESDRDA